MSSLYELTGQMLQLQSILEEGDEDDIQATLDTMESLDYEIELKADGYARIIRNLTADVEGLKSEIDRLTGRKKYLENSISSLKQRLEDSMILTGKEKFKTELFSFNIQSNPPRLVVDKPEAVPQEFLIPQDPKIDSAGIKQAIKDGVPIDFAHLEQGRSLRIK